ncbi:hypothetical protein J4H86_18120 [Spiractinospora alimapuensis]|uniref:hypothetical protein n=1 Tax=Spiractinospora alimapuensis TaxID=2820884 RepID=UPI001F3FF1B8|nr:hypothetical protein [Spiractinospora alimapuensis]QVQ50781.1 hypothetical protein J4H86_18120 [Spiractinospora alimapuensis]
MAAATTLGTVMTAGVLTAGPALAQPETEAQYVPAPADDESVISVAPGADRATIDGNVNGATPLEGAGIGLFAADASDPVDPDGGVCAVDADDLDAVGPALRDLMLEMCGNSLNVVNKVVPQENTGDDISGAIPMGSGLNISGDAPNGDVGGLPDTQSTTGDGTGTVTFPLTFDGSADSAEVAVHETQRDGYTLVTQDGQNAVCRDFQGDPIPVENDDSDPANPGFTIDMPADDVVTCTIYNRPLPDQDLVVDKRWEINGETYEEGDQPDGFDAQLTLTGPGDEDASDQDRGVGREGYEVGEEATIDGSVTVPDRCTVDLTQVTEINGDAVTEDLPAEVTVEKDGTHATVTNAVTCKKPKQGLTVDKTWEINGETYEEGDQPDGFDAQLTLTGPGDEGASDQDWGVPREGYKVGEEATIDETVDVPDRCTVDLTQVTEINGELAAVDLPHDVTVEKGGTHATVTNTVTCAKEARLTLEKNVENTHGGEAEPEDWTLVADGPTPISGVSGSEQVTNVEVEEGAYVLSEADGPEGYVASDWTCRWDDEEETSEGAEIEIGPGDDVTCSITNSDTEPEPSPTPSPTPEPTPGPGEEEPGGGLPVTGGALIGLTSVGLLLMGGGTAAVWWARKRRFLPWSD